MPNRYGRGDRVTIVLPHAVAERLRQRAFEDGRSISNLCAVLLERATEAVTYAEPQ